MSAHEEKSWGLAGIGRHAEVVAELIEPIDGEGPWHLQFSGTGWEFRMDVSGKDDVRALSAFVSVHAGRTVFGEHRIGSFCTADVVILKDDEFEDRFFLRILGEGLMAGVTIQDDEAVSFRKALEDLVLDLEE